MVYMPANNSLRGCLAARLSYIWRSFWRNCYVFYCARAPAWVANVWFHPRISFVSLFCGRKKPRAIAHPGPFQGRPDSRHFGGCRSHRRIGALHTYDYEGQVFAQESQADSLPTAVSEFVTLHPGSTPGPGPRVVHDGGRRAKAPPRCIYLHTNCNPPPITSTIGPTFGISVSGCPRGASNALNPSLLVVFGFKVYPAPSSSATTWPPPTHQALSD